MKMSERLANVALAGLTLAPLVVKVNPNVNVVLTACLTVYIGCHRSVKPAPPSETMSKEHAMRFPLIGSVVLFSLFLLFKFLSKDLVNAILTCYFFVLGIIALSATLLPAIERFLPKQWNEVPINWHLPYFRSVEIEFTKSQVVAAIPGTFFCTWYALKKHWLANNILGLAFCIQGIEMLSLGSFKTGAILLAGLFVYDIFWVFFTPVMVSVAKSFDAPIKLLFPTKDLARPYSMLGLGDIVIPGIFVALALRFDVSRGKGDRYFRSAFLGYSVGLIVTIIVMNWFQAAQPALLYIVPGVIGFLAVHCIWNGEVKPLLEFDESKTSDDSSSDDSSKQAKDSAFVDGKSDHKSD
uniref:TSA: Wollemia nobilis Ref_Wollemi_Transcript_18749_1749 transcribed RNA sequence n=1 Tax=Wollemia nobilis TaxID=56998 RepID=A0A0C9QNB2_9CONI